MLHATVDPNTIPPAGVWLARPLGLNAPSAVVRSERLFALSQADEMRDDTDQSGNTSGSKV